MRPNINDLIFRIEKKLEALSRTHIDHIQPYDFVVIIEIDSAIGDEQIKFIEADINAYLIDNHDSIKLRLISKSEFPEHRDAIVIAKEGVNEGWQVRKQTLSEAFADDLRRQGYLEGERLVKWVDVQFHKETCEKIKGGSIDSSFFKKELLKYIPEEFKKSALAQTFYRITEPKNRQSNRRGYYLEDLNEGFVTLPGGVGEVVIKPFGIHNPSGVAVHFTMPNLNFARIEGIVLLPGQTLKVTQKLNLEMIRKSLQDQVDDPEYKVEVDGGYELTLMLPASEFDLLPEQCIVFKSLPRISQLGPERHLFPGEQRRYELFYVGACMRALRTEIYVSDLDTSGFDLPIAMTGCNTKADHMQWYAFHQSCELQILQTAFHIRPDYLFHTNSDPLHIRNVHLIFNAMQAGDGGNVRQRCEILLESSDKETKMILEEPKPALITSFCEYDVTDIPLGQDRFQLRIKSSYRKILSQNNLSSSTDETILEVREGTVAGNKPWKIEAFDQPFVFKHHVLKVVKN
jgi:hypothetical protein